MCWNIEKKNAFALKSLPHLRVVTKHSIFISCKIMCIIRNRCFGKGRRKKRKRCICDKRFGVCKISDLRFRSGHFSQIPETRDSAINRGFTRGTPLAQSRNSSGIPSKSDENPTRRVGRYSLRFQLVKRR
jgi:hypothetical protein